MPSYVVILKNDDYLILLKNVAQRSDGHPPLLQARNPASSQNRAIICSENVFEELLNLTRRVCPRVSVEISTQIQWQNIDPKAGGASAARARNFEETCQLY